MTLTVASFKSGVGKTTSAVHLAAYLQRKAPTVLVDGDQNRSASGWAVRGRLPFTVADEREARRIASGFDHIVIDTQARPRREDLKALADGCDLLIIPSTPDALALDALTKTTDALGGIAAGRYRVLLTVIPPKPSRDGEEARTALREIGVPLFKQSIRRLGAFQKAALAGVPAYEIHDPPR